MNCCCQEGGQVGHLIPTHSLGYCIITTTTTRQPEDDRFDAIQYTILEVRDFRYLLLVNDR